MKGVGLLAKVHAIISTPTNQEEFDKYYFGIHIPMGEQLPHLKKLSIQKVVGTNYTMENLYIVTELEYENIELLQESLASDIGCKVRGDVQNLAEFLPKPPDIVITD